MITRETEKKNVIFNSGLEDRDRFCTHCHSQLVNHTDNKLLFKCPTCGVISSIQNTEPGDSIEPNFPAQQGYEQKQYVYQSTEQRLPRNVYYQLQRLEEKSVNDPYFRYLKDRSDLKITNIDYYEPT